MRKLHLLDTYIRLTNNPVNGWDRPHVPWGELQPLICPNILKQTQGEQSYTYENKNAGNQRYMLIE